MSATKQQTGFSNRHLWRPKYTMKMQVEGTNLSNAHSEEESPQVVAPIMKKINPSKVKVTVSPKNQTKQQSPFVQREEVELVVSRPVSSELNQRKGVDVSVTADSKMGVQVDSPDFGARVKDVEEANLNIQHLSIDNIVAAEMTKTVFQR